MKNIKANDIKDWVYLMVKKTLRDSKEQGINVLKDVSFTVLVNTAYIMLEISHYDCGVKQNIKEEENAEFKNTVVEFKKNMSIYTTDLYVVDEYIENYGYIIINISDNIQITE